MNLYKHYFFVFACFLLAGCSGLYGQSNCNKVADNSCMTVSQANEKAKNFNNYKNTSLINNSNKSNSANNELSSRLNNVTMATTKQANNVKGNKKILALIDDDTNPKRTREKVHKILITSYVDVDDNLHEDQIIYFATDSKQWTY